MSSHPPERELDRVDRQLLSLLQADGRLTVAELARNVNLTLTPCIERVRRLERDGFIEGYYAHLNPKRLGQSMLAFTEVTLDHATQDVLVRTGQWERTPFIGRHGWVSVVDFGALDWDEIEELATDAWRLTAPKRLVREWEEREA